MRPECTHHQRRKTHLLLTNKRTPQHTDSLADHAHIEFQGRSEPVYDFLQSGIILELKAIPERPLGGAVLALLRGNRF